MSTAPGVVLGSGGQPGSVNPTSSPPGTIIYVPMGPVPTPNANNYCEKYRHRQSIGTGAGQAVVGILCIIFNAIGLGFSYRYSGSSLYVGHGFWSGILFIITGALGVSAGQTKFRCKIITYMTTSVLSACCAGIMFAIAVPGAAALQPRIYDCRPYPSYDEYNYYGSACIDMNRYRVVLAMQILIALLAFAEAVLAIWGSAIGCRVVCCCAPVATQGVILPASYLSGNGQMMYISQLHGTSYIYNPSLPYPSGQGPAIEAVGPPPYQASYVQTPWSQPPSLISPPLYYPPPPPPPTANFVGGSEPRAFPANPPHSAEDDDPPQKC